MAIKSAQDALDKFEIARQYASHIQAVTEDRHLETFFEASWGIARKEDDKHYFEVPTTPQCLKLVSMPA